MCGTSPSYLSTGATFVPFLSLFCSRLRSFALRIVSRLCRSLFASWLLGALCVPKKFGEPSCLKIYRRLCCRRRSCHARLVFTYDPFSKVVLVRSHATSRPKTMELLLAFSTLVLNVDRLIRRGAGIAKGAASNSQRRHLVHCLCVSM